MWSTGGTVLSRWKRVPVHLQRQTLFHRVSYLVCLVLQSSPLSSPDLLNSTTNKTKIYHYFPHKIFEVFMALRVNIMKYNKLFLTHETWGPHSGVAEDSDSLLMSLCVMAQAVTHFLKEL